MSSWCSASNRPDIDGVRRLIFPAEKGRVRLFEIDRPSEQGVVASLVQYELAIKSDEIVCLAVPLIKTQKESGSAGVRPGGFQRGSIVRDFAVKEGVRFGQPRSLSRPNAMLGNKMSKVVHSFGVPFSLLSLSLVADIGLVPVTLAHGRTESVPLNLGWGNEP